MTEDFHQLVQAFMRASRVQHAPKESYWASNIVSGVGMGTKSLAEGFCLGIGGVLCDPYNETVEHGISGLPRGVAKGVSGLVAKPIRGTFDFVAQPIAGALNTPGYVYKKLSGADEVTQRELNFRLFGLDAETEFEQQGENDTRLLASRPRDDVEEHPKETVERHRPLAD